MSSPRGGGAGSSPVVRTARGPTLFTSRPLDAGRPRCVLSAPTHLSHDDACGGRGPRTSWTLPPAAATPVRSRSGGRRSIDRAPVGSYTNGGGRDLTDLAFSTPTTTATTREIVLVVVVVFFLYFFTFSHVTSHFTLTVSLSSLSPKSPNSSTTLSLPLQYSCSC